MKKIILIIVLIKFPNFLNYQILNNNYKLNIQLFIVNIISIIFIILLKIISIIKFIKFPNSLSNIKQ